MIPVKRRLQGSLGFTLVELLAVIVIILVLATITFKSITGMYDRARVVQCASNLRSLVAGTLNWASERNGMLWSRSEIGYSKYRMADDPKGLPDMMKEYVPKQAWLCPGGRKSLEKFGNNYTWTVASQFDTQPVSAVDSVSKTLLYWDAFAYSLPSMKGASEDIKGDGTSTGPATLATKLQFKPHTGNTKVNYGYLDGHVETR